MMLIVFTMVISSCQKEILSNEGNSSFTVYDAYNPVDHDMNQNGLFFMDKTKDVAMNDYLTIFGFDPEGNFMFKERNALTAYLENSANYSNIRLTEMLVEDNVLVVGDAQQGSSTYVFVSEIDQSTGVITAQHTIEVSNVPADFEYDTKMVKTSYGYMFFVVGQYGLFNILKMTKTDQDFNVFDSSDLILGTGTVVLNDAVATSNDELVLAYFRVDATNNPFFVRSVNPDFTPNWLQTFAADYSLTDSAANRHRDLMFFNNEILLFTTGVFSGTVGGSTVNTSTPAFYNIDPMSGVSNSYHVVPGSFQNAQGETTVYGTENLSCARQFNNSEIIVSGYVSTQNVFSGAMIHYGSNFSLSNSFFINDQRPISRFHFVGINSEGDYIGSGYTPRFSPASFIDPTISGDVLSVFVGNYNSSGNLNIE